jgi:hypothetical protein
VLFRSIEMKAGLGQADALVFAPTDQWTVGQVQLVSEYGSARVKVGHGLGRVEAVYPETSR